ncbi:STAS domain-containing protein [Leisingera caerulea]|uniref:STAS domain-containing protein n=1 Tax=Leisingera caerulea TaxID=506591 RepID=A0A9Q9HDP4_LEICA|nr:STAS domain-containing protein [Leisingera caerulea]UWQ49097.1 STAS domain-containing protein [Leisingera caerulea]UWQ53218.1 STAS domain-containing protein [Leisingera caerulea]
MDAASIHLVEDVLLVAIQEDITDTDILDLQDVLSERVSAEGARGVVIDISTLEIVDTFVGRVIAQLANIANLLDAETFVVGMRPAVAMTLVELGMNLPETRTALSLTHAMQRLRAAAGG